MATAERSSTSAALFGKFKTNVADEFRREDVVMVANYFNLKPAQKDEIESAKAPGLTLLNCLHRDDIIKEDDIHLLRDALTYCGFISIARRAEEEFEKYKCQRGRKTDGRPPNPADYADTGRTFYDLGTLKIILQHELTSHNCFELAIYFSLSEQVVNKVHESRSYAKELAEALEHRNIINERNISALLNALEDRSLKRVVNKIKEQQHIVTKEEEGPATLTQGGGSGDSVKCKICKTGSFKEFMYEDKIVALECQNEDCLSTWVAAPTSSTSEMITVNYNNQTLSYKPPGKLDLSKIKYEVVQDIEKLEPGDHIIFRRLVFMYDHHAILVSTESSTLDVIHWTSRWPSLKSLLRLKSDAVVDIKNDKKSFPSGGVRRVVYDQQVRQDQKELVLARALDLLQSSDKDYSLTENNCESLATYCKSGIFYSVQGQFAKKFRPPFQRLFTS